MGDTSTLHQLKLVVNNATLKETGGLFTKGDPFAEVVVDSQPPHKTDCVKATWEPCWNHSFDLLVSCNEDLLFLVSND